MIGTLVAHCGAVRVSRDDLEGIATPPPTRTWKPVSHYELVSTLDDLLIQRGLKVRAESFAVQREGALLFGVIDLAWSQTEEFAAAIGLRTGNDKSFALQIAVGVRVFVCDNLAFSGDLIVLRRRHTSGLNISRELDRALASYEEKMPALRSGIARLKEPYLSDVEAKAWIFDAFRQGILPVRFFRPVSERFFNTTVSDENGGRTLWHLHNAFTASVRELPPGPAFEATTHLGQFFNLGRG